MSTNKTQNYQLHAWEPGDNFLLSEINQNFAAIDGILAEMPESKKLRVVVGSYQGDSLSEEQLIPLTFHPRAVFISAKYSYNYYPIILCADGAENLFVQLGDDGFAVRDIFNIPPTHYATNVSGRSLNPYRYIAFGYEE